MFDQSWVAGRAKPAVDSIGVLVNGRLEVRNAQSVRRFTASVSVDDTATDKTHAVTFAVHSDSMRRDPGFSRP
ncbi:hypothetical protein [Mesorhizobium loti]|uniref:Uncharacterized protein n=1 Tax=Rhizobium loti TaxID=381 RepID=A0AA91J182_RHILI|nr:hypothetical protein [Mesorhizobium loti]OBQ62235.1 hypothetical protein A8145_21500 [Mesorhizobium loti]